MIKASTLLDKQELSYLKELYINSPKQFHNQDVNLFFIYKAGIKLNKSDLWDNIQKKLLKFHGKETAVTNYFLEYIVGSYTKNHQDNPDTVEGTAITLIEKSNDLVGGEIIAGQGDNQRTLPLLVGQTMYYTSAVYHGVTKVEQGKRIVLITWFRKDTWQR